MGKKIALFAFSVLCITFALIGCGGGGGGGTTGNPVGPVAVTGPLADLSGTVKFSDQPLADAAVYLYKSEKALQAGVSSLASLRGSVLAQTKLAEGSYFTKTDNSGRYSFTGIPVGEYTLIAVKDETHQFAQTGVLLGSVTTADAQLTPTGKVSGRLLLSGGQPARGAIVHLEKTSYVAISDVNGDFTINNIPAGQNFTLGVVTTQGTLQNPVAINITPAEDRQLGNLTLTVPVQQVTAINGSVSAVDSSVPTSALNGRIVLVTSADPTPLVALTDSSGNFSLNVKAVGNYNVSVVGGEFAVAPTVQTVAVSTLGTTVTVPQSFVLSKPTVVLPPSTQFYTYSGTLSKRGKAFNEPDNAGVPLTLTSTDASANVFSAVTSPTGSFTFSIPAGTYNLAVGGGYAFETTFANPVTINAPTVLNTLIWVVPTQVFTENFLVEGSLTKVARVNGETDDANVIVTLTPTTGAAVTFAGSTTSAGDFAVRVPAGTYNLAVTGDYKFETAFTNPITVSAATNVGTGIRLIPVNPVAVSYTVTGSINKTDFIDGETDNGGVIVTLTNIDASAELYSTVTTSGGAFSFNVDPGTYTLAINSGYKFATTFPNPIDASVGNVTLASVIDIVPLATKMFSLSGSINKVIKKAGESNNGDLTVTLRSDSATFLAQTAVTEANGSFAFKVPAGNYAIEVGSGYVFVNTPSGFPYVITNADLAISPAVDVRPAGVVPATIGGSITPPRPNNHYRVRIEKTDGSYTDNETTASDFYFNNLTPGEYKLVVLPDANGYYIESALLNVAEGQNLTGISLSPSAVAPSISTISVTENVLTIIGSGFGTDVSSFSILVDGNRRARPAAFTLTDTQDQAMIVSVTPGQHNIVAEKIWKRPTTTETFVLKSVPFSFNKAIGSPLNVSVNDITDISARISWTNANFTSKSIVDVFQVSNGSQAASVVLDGTSFQVTGLLASTSYVAHVYNRFGDIESTQTTVNFATRNPGLNAASSVTLANSASFLNLDSTSMAVFGFEMMNDKIYIAYASSPSDVFVKSYSSDGSELNTWQIPAWFGATMSRVSMCSGDNKIFVTYSDNPTTVQKMAVLDENLSLLGSVFSFDTIVGDVDQIKVEYHGGRVYAAFTYYSTVNEVYLYAFNSDLTSPTLVYSAQNTFAPDNYFIQTAADEASGDLYVAVSSGSINLHDSTQVIRKSLANPTLPGITLGFVRFTSTAETITEFHVYGNDLITNGNFGYVKMSRSSGLATSLTNVSNSLSNFGVDARGRLWSFMYESNGSKYLVNHENNSVARSLKITDFPIVYSDFPSAVGFREFIKLQKDGNFGMLYVNDSNALAVYKYNSSF